jgi:hypothetical protein
VSKSYTGETVYEGKDAPETPESKTPENNPENSEKAAQLTLRARVAAIRAKHTTN